MIPLAIFSFLDYNAFITGFGKDQTMTRETDILWTEITDFPEGWGIRRHAHKNYYHLFYFVRGTGVFLIGEKKYDILPGSCFLLPPGVVHGLEDSANKELLSYEIKFVLHDETLCGQLGAALVRSDQGDFFQVCVAAVHKNGLSHQAGRRNTANHFLCALLGRLAEGQTAPEQKNSELIDTSAYSAPTVQIIAYIESNYMHHIYLDDIAEHVEYNRNYMCSLFKTDTNLTVVDYLNYVRIRKACEYILYSDIGFSQICYRVGFLNLSHFNRTFKKLVGATPSAYSKMVDIDDNNLFVKGESSHFPTLEKAIEALKAGDS